MAPGASAHQELVGCGLTSVVVEVVRGGLVGLGAAVDAEVTSVPLLAYPLVS